MINQEVEKELRGMANLSFMWADQKQALLAAADIVADGARTDEAYELAISELRAKVASSETKLMKALCERDELLSLRNQLLAKITAAEAGWGETQKSLLSEEGEVLQLQAKVATMEDSCSKWLLLEQVESLAAENRDLKSLLAMKNKTADTFMKQVWNLQSENLELMKAIGFYSSVIKSGEPWTQTCEDVLTKSLAK